MGNVLFKVHSLQVTVSVIQKQNKTKKIPRELSFGNCPPALSQLAQLAEWLPIRVD